MNSNLSSGKGLTKSYHYSLSLFPSLLVNSKDEIRSFVEKFFYILLDCIVDKIGSDLMENWRGYNQVKECIKVWSQNWLEHSLIVCHDLQQS